MKKVVSSRADELRKARDEWEAEDARRSELRNQERAAYRQAKSEILAPVKKLLEDGLAKFDMIPFDIRVETGSHYGSEGAEISVEVDRWRAEPKSPLSWSYKAYIDENGEVQKESGSWSGLEACSPEAVAYLRQTADAIEFLNNLDYASILNIKEPRYDDYFTDESRPLVGKPNFEHEIAVAELTEAIGTDKMFIGYPYDEDEEYGSSIYRNRIPLLYMILGETPKQFKIARIPESRVRRLAGSEDKWSREEIIEYVKRNWSRRTAKSKIFEGLKKPLEEFDLDAVIEEEQAKAAQGEA